MLKLIRVLLIVSTGVVCCLPVWAQDLAGEEMRSLDGQVQEIKSDVLGIAAELSTLEERLLFPSNTQLAVFVSLASGEDVRLDALRIEIDGEPVAHYIYSFKELEALQEGGVQRVYTGNVATGMHEMTVSIDGKSPSGSDFSETESFSFNKGIDPRLIGLTVAGPSLGQAAIQLGEW